MLIDSHCHINSPELRNDARSVIIRAREAGVMKMLIAGCDFEDSCEAVALSEDFSQFGLYASIGIHPHESSRYESIPDAFSRLVHDTKVVAVGEIGLDYHYDNSPREIQRKMFEAQLEFAEREKMPVILHIRDAMNDALAILSDYGGLKMLFHCYSGGFKYLDDVLEFDSMCAFGGALTWPSKGLGELRDVFRKIPLERILLETDSPYMTPVPFRGKTNEPAYIKHVYDKAAELRSMTVEELASQIETNAKEFFKWE